MSLMSIRVATHITYALEHAHARCLEGWRVVEVRPDGVLLERSLFGRSFGIHVTTEKGRRR